MNNPEPIIATDPAGNTVAITVIGNGIDVVIIKRITGEEIVTLYPDPQVKFIQAIYDTNPAIRNKFQPPTVSALEAQIATYRAGLAAIHDYVGSSSWIGNEAAVKAMCEKYLNQK